MEKGLISIFMRVTLKTDAGLMYFEVSVKFASYFYQISIKIATLITYYFNMANLFLSGYLANNIILSDNA